jgi:small subunit ribosomal protein S6
LRAYEVMLILPAEADEKVVTTAVDRITKAIEPSGGSVLNIDRWGRRRFAFEVDRQTEGYYAVVAFDAEPSTVAPLERALTLADEVLRAKVTIRHPKKAESKDEVPRGSRRPTSRPAPAAEPPADADASSSGTSEPGDDASPTASPETVQTETSPAPA